jgi:hypothetical protein
MTEISTKKWNKQYEKLAEFKRKNGHCLVPSTYQEDMALENWVNAQQRSHSNNKLRLDRKVLLDELGFAWKLRATGNYKRKTWQLQYEKLVEFKQKKWQLYRATKVPGRRGSWDLG